MHGITIGRVIIPICRALDISHLSIIVWCKIYLAMFKVDPLFQNTYGLCRASSSVLCISGVLPMPVSGHLGFFPCRFTSNLGSSLWYVLTLLGREIDANHQDFRPWRRPIGRWYSESSSTLDRCHPFLTCHSLQWIGPEFATVQQAPLARTEASYILLKPSELCYCFFGFITRLSDTFLDISLFLYCYGRLASQ